MIDIMRPLRPAQVASPRRSTPLPGFMLHGSAREALLNQPDRRGQPLDRLPTCSCRATSTNEDTSSSRSQRRSEHSEPPAHDRARLSTMGMERCACSGASREAAYGARAAGAGPPAADLLRRRSVPSMAPFEPCFLLASGLVGPGMKGSMYFRQTM